MVLNASATHAYQEEIAVVKLLKSHQDVHVPTASVVLVANQAAHAAPRAKLLRSKHAPVWTANVDLHATQASHVAERSQRLLLYAHALTVNVVLAANQVAHAAPQTHVALLLRLEIAANLHHAAHLLKHHAEEQTVNAHLEDASLEDLAACQMVAASLSQQ